MSRIIYRWPVLGLLACAVLTVACGDAPRDPGGSCGETRPSSEGVAAADSYSPPDRSLAALERVVPAESILTLEVREGPLTFTGSALVYDDARHLITAGHVVACSTSVRAFVGDRAVTGTVIGDDFPFTDVAVLTVDTPLPPAVSFSAAPPRPGDPVIAAGWVGGQREQRAGRISATRGTTIVGRPDDTARPLMLVIDALKASISGNPGRSGGALVDERGAVVGLLLGGGAAGTFALPAAELQEIADVIIECRCDYPRPDFGATGVITIFADNRTQLGAPLPTGAILGGIVPGSPFDQAGLMAGDIVLSFDDVEITEFLWYHNALKEVPPGEPVRVTYWRAGEVHTAEVTPILRER